MNGIKIKNDFDKNIISQKITDKYSFGIKILDDVSDLIYSRTEASYNQIQIKIIQNIGFIFAYAGLNKTINNSFYLYDLSPTGLGKSSVVSNAKKLLLKPVIKEVELKHKEELEKVKNEKKPFKKMIKAIHGELISPEALYSSIEQIQVQMIEVGELGKALLRDMPIIDYLIRNYGENFITIPSYKNNVEATNHFIENVCTFFYGDTNLEYLGHKNFYHHLNGGLLNRGLIAFNNNPKPFELLPKYYFILNNEINKYNTIVKDILFFTRKEYLKLRYIDNSYSENSLYLAFRKDIYNKKTELLKAKNPFANLYVRLMQNTNAILYTLHFLDCYYKGVFSPIIDNSTIELGLEYINNFIANYDNLIDDLLNYQDSMEEELENRVIEKMNELLAEKGNCTLREIYKPLKISSQKAKVIVKSYVKQYSDKYILEENNRSIKIYKKTKRQ